MRTKELPAIEYPADYSNDNHTYFQTEEMADNPNKQPERKASMVGESLYLILGVEKTADSEQIKKAYRKKALRLHPDKNHDNPDKAKLEAEFKELNRANKILSDEQLRPIYDSYGSVGLELAEQVGPENVATLMKMQTPAAKFGMCLVFCLTGFCCGCFCCCCFCCFFCCGKLKPKVPEDDEQADLFQGSDSETPNEAPAGGYSSYQNDTPVTAQPAAAAPEGASEKPVIAMPPPPSYGDQ
jgi:DnaJ family protein C protein 5